MNTKIGNLRALLIRHPPTDRRGGKDGKGGSDMVCLSGLSALTPPSEIAWIGPIGHSSLFRFVPLRDKGEMERVDQERKAGKYQRDRSRIGSPRLTLAGSCFLRLHLFHGKGLDSTYTIPII